MSKSYPSKLHHVIASATANHFWFRARRELLTAILRRYISDPQNKRFCEIGFGTGDILLDIEHYGFQTTGIDINAKAISYMNGKTRASLIQTSLATYHPKKKFDAIGLFDVLEHQVNDKKFFHQCVSILQPHGFFFLTVPAGHVFWSQFDVLSGHVRRYTPDTLFPLFEKEGLTIVWWNYWNCFLSPGLFVRKYMQPSSLTPFFKIPSKFINWLFYGILHFETMLFFSLRYLCGASIVVIARRSKIKN